MLRDFGKFDVDGTKSIQRWYKFGWTENTDGVVKKISDSLSTIVRDHIDSASKRFGGGGS
jgi:hypothetical protein